MSKVLQVLFLILAAGAGCGRETLHLSDPHAIVTDVQFKQSYQIIQKIDYLPFHYLVDGCYARALYMSMELAAERIPSSAIFAFADGPLLELADGTMWTYHVAPMLKNGPTGEETIVDPAMGEGPYLPLKKWLTNMTHGGAHPEIDRVEGSWYGPEAARGRLEPLISDFADLDPFHASDIAKACDTMYNYIHLDATEHAKETLVRSNLLSRTQALMHKLANLGKMERDGLTQFRCGRDQLPVP